MMRFSIDRLSIMDYRQNRISRPLGWVSPLSLCGGGGLRNRNVSFKRALSSTKTERKLKNVYVFLTTTCWGLFSWRMVPSRGNFSAFLKLLPRFRRFGL